jgi:hypothetical protein
MHRKFCKRSTARNGARCKRSTEGTAVAALLYGLEPIAALSTARDGRQTQPQLLCARSRARSWQLNAALQPPFS